MSKNNSLIESKWLFNASKKFITIQDMLSMKEGDIEWFYFFDRNLFEFTHENKENKKYTPNKFFKNGYAIKYTHVYGIFGKWEWYSNNKLLYEESNCIDYDYFQVHLENDMWIKLTDGKMCQLPKPQPPVKFPNNLENKFWHVLPKNTLVGWRGPMMKLKDLKKMPNIYWSKNDDKLEGVNKIKIYA
jgi:hypothetical protein